MIKTLQIEAKPLLEAQISLLPSVLAEDINLASLKHFSLTFNQEKPFQKIRELLSRAANLESLSLIGAGKQNNVELVVSH